ncbi:hypothetical protein GOBAR_DD26964 [Gossypium barbadense]|nr:hypothetical protein GOBAR_DD26964 [Gossypium barbadense]
MAKTCFHGVFVSIACAARADFYFNGIDFPYSKPTGRFSNGLNTADQIVRLLGLKKSPPPFLYLVNVPSNFQKNILQGANFASGGSGILRDTGKAKRVIPLEEQIQQFSTIRSNITNMTGSEEATDKILSKAFILISIGSNDMFEYLLDLSKPMSLAEFNATLISTYEYHIKTLYELGARTFGILTVPPIGCTPFARAVFTGNNSCSEPAQAMAVQFYFDVASSLEQFSSTVQDMKYSVGNTFLMTSVLTGDKLAFGLKNIAAACCGNGTYENPMYFVAMRCLPPNYKRDWSGLPDELLTKIGQYVSGHFDMIRFRSVCRRWRHSLPLSHTNNWHLHLQITLLKEPKPDYRIRIPLPFYESYDPELEAESSPYHTVPSSIVKTTVCIINQSSLLKLEETQQEEYDDKVCMVLVLCDHGRLLFWRNGDEHMKEISNKFRYDDIAVYKGHFIAIDRWGTVSFVDSSSLTVIQYTPPVLSGGKKKNLVVCSEQLYVADRYFDRARTSQNPYGKWDPSVVDFKIYKLDEDWGRWIEITSLNDQILFLGKDQKVMVFLSSTWLIEGLGAYYLSLVALICFVLHHGSAKVFNLY